jgi:hypothetical protein
MSISVSTAPRGYGGYAFDWSPAEKKVARRAFEGALKRELDDLVAETKRRASQIQDPDDIWELVDHLIERRKQFNAQYDYRYSVLPWTLANLIRAGRLREQDLKGLREDKLAKIRRLSKLGE